QEVLGEGGGVLGHLDQPRQDGIGVNFKHPGHGTDAEPFRQCAHRPHQQIGWHTLAMQRRAMGLLEIATTARAIHLAPRSTAGMAIGTDIAPSPPALIRTVRMRAEMLRGVYLARSSARGDHAGWRATGRLGGMLEGMLTGSTVGLCGEARKGGGLTVALWRWGCGLQCRRVRGSGVAWPRSLEHDAQPHQGDQHQLVKKEMGDHGTTPSSRWRNEGILPGLAGYRISRRMQVHDLNWR